MKITPSNPQWVSVSLRRPERLKEIVYRDIGGWYAVADEWKDEDHLASATHWLDGDPPNAAPKELEHGDYGLTGSASIAAPDTPTPETDALIHQLRYIADTDDARFGEIATTLTNAATMLDWLREHYPHILQKAEEYTNAAPQSEFLGGGASLSPHSTAVAAPTPETDALFTAYEFDKDAVDLRKGVEKLERKRYEARRTGSEYFAVMTNRSKDAEKAEREREDAARYRWMRSWVGRLDELEAIHLPNPKTPEEADAIIDAMRKAGP